MPLFETSRAAVRTPGPHIIDIAQPRVINGLSLGRIGMLFQTDWGPVKSAKEPTSPGDFVKTYFPDGSGRASTGWLATTRRKKAPWTAVRILGGSAGLLPPSAPTLTVQGTPGTKVAKYLIVAKNGSGATVAGAWARVATAPTTLNSTDKVKIDWEAVPGATGYDVYRTYIDNTATPNTIGKIGTTASLTLTDTGLAGDTTTPPTANTTGYAQAVTDLYTDSAATAANATAGVAVLRIVWKYPGTLPNTAGSVATSAASNGDANSFDLTATLTNSKTGSTVEKWTNLKDFTTVALPSNMNGGRSTVSPSTVANSYLVDKVLLLGTPAARPGNATWTPSNGSNGGTIAGTDYDAGCTALASQDNILVVTADDCGDSIRADVNAAIYAHVLAKTDRFGFLSLSQGDSWATVKGSSGNGVGVYRHKLIKYFPWVNVRDIDGVEQKSPGASFAATATANLDPNEPDAWWDEKVTEYFTGISSLDSSTFDPGDETIQGDATDGGIALFIKLDSGRYALLHDRTTSLTVSERFGMTQKLRRQMARELKVGLAPWTNGPNDDASQRAVARAMTRYFADRARRGWVAVQTKAYLDTYPMWAIGEAMFTVDGDAGNTADTVAAGEYAVAANVVTPSVMEKLLVLFNVGTGPVIQ